MKRTMQQVSSIAALAVALACFAVGGALLLGWIVLDQQGAPLQSATAVVTGSRIEAGEWKWGKFPQQGADHFLLTVAFPHESGQAEAVALQVNETVFDAHPVGSTLTVWYAPERPDFAVVGSPQDLASKRSRYGELFGWLLLGIGAAGAAVLGNRLHVARGGKSLL